MVKHLTSRATILSSSSGVGVGVEVDIGAGGEEFVEGGVEDEIVESELVEAGVEDEMVVGATCNLLGMSSWKESSTME